VKLEHALTKHALEGIHTLAAYLMFIILLLQTSDDFEWKTTLLQMKYSGKSLSRANGFDERKYRVPDAERGRHLFERHF
jgi:hypothetical protein